ncbi:unnamed protein product [Lactuca virosa]|uniref:cyclin-dependent kinase n=1 Tax=Lactuca virosa TaxID=75947 RepID=A0AAU9MYJ6_9ASTR|nr:unnamed protein product [Lactuca virosa]
MEMDEEGIPPTALREISLLQMLSNSIYIVRLICVQHIHHNDKPLLYLVFEYLDTDLKKFIDSHRKGPNPSPLPPSQIQSFLFQLCKGVAHCHGHGVLHSHKTCWLTKYLICSFLGWFDRDHHTKKEEGFMNGAGEGRRWLQGAPVVAWSNAHSGSNRFDLVV